MQNTKQKIQLADDGELISIDTDEQCCTNCGSTNSPSANFCSVCGARLFSETGQGDAVSYPNRDLLDSPYMLMHPGTYLTASLFRLFGWIIGSIIRLVIRFFRTY